MAHSSSCALGETAWEYGDLGGLDRKGSGKAKSPRMCSGFTEFMRVGEVADASYEAQREQPAARAANRAPKMSNSGEPPSAALKSLGPSAIATSRERRDGLMRRKRSTERDWVFSSLNAWPPFRIMTFV